MKHIKGRKKLSNIIYIKIDGTVKYIKLIHLSIDIVVGIYNNENDNFC